MGAWECDQRSHFDRGKGPSSQEVPSLVESEEQGAAQEDKSGERGAC